MSIREPPGALDHPRLRPFAALFACYRCAFIHPLRPPGVQRLSPHYRYRDASSSLDNSARLALCRRARRRRGRRRRLLLAADRPAPPPNARRHDAEPDAAGQHGRGARRRHRAAPFGCRGGAAEPAAAGQKLPLAQIYPMLLDRLVDGMLVTEAGRKEHLDQDPGGAAPAEALRGPPDPGSLSQPGDQGRRDRGPAQGALRDLRQGKGGARRGACAAHPRQDRGRGEIDHRRARQGRRFRRARQEIFDRPRRQFGRRSRLFRP